MANLAFIGRKTQLDILRAITSKPGQSSITAIYGRRRIGKTRLVREATVGRSLLDFEGLEGAGSAEQKRHFLRTLARHSGQLSHQLASAGADWTQLLLLLAESIGKNPHVVFFDEFQWMAGERNELVSKLKYVWDSQLAVRGGVHLILCGSVSSFLVKKIVHSKALYGRIDHVIALGPLEFGDVKTGFFPERSTLEALEYYLTVGGVPKYLEIIDPRRSVRLNLADACFRPGAFFHEEFDRIFISHFGRVRHYRSIIELLAKRGFATREEIASHLDLRSGGRISTFLENLSLAGFIEGYNSVLSTRTSNLKRYRIIDPYLRFYFRFIAPIAGRIARSPAGVPLHQALPEERFEAYLGQAFESFCRQHSHVIARKLGFSSVAYDCGSWFKRGDTAPGAQIDLLFSRADRVITVCEIKYRRSVTPAIIGEVQRKVDALEIKGTKTVEKVLISAIPPTREVYESGYFTAILTADDFVS